MSSASLGQQAATINLLVSSWSRWLAHGLLLLPLLWLIYLLLNNGLGPDPAEKLVRDLGFNGACILWLCLAMTPLRIITGKSLWLRYRRLLGLWGFFYLSLHLLAFLVFWAGLSLPVITDELTNRPYIYVGMTAWLLLVPLALTSTKAAQRRLKKNWVRLHKLVYPVAGLALLHILWISKLDYSQALSFAAVLAVLLGVRWVKYWKRRGK